MTAEPMQLARPVFFVGFMGAGKTSVARRLARTCGISSVDMDTYLERREGKRVKEIFAEGGEDAFRAIETDVLRELASKEEPLVISCGGGIVLREENREILAESGFVVHLQVTVDEAASRISDKSSRPLFQDIDAARKRCLERAPLYSGVADVEINTAGSIKPVGRFYPHPELLSLFHEAGVPITVGSDAHVVTRVGENIDQAYALAAAAGYRSIDVPTAAGGWRSVSIA